MKTMILTILSSGVLFLAQTALAQSGFPIQPIPGEEQPAGESHCRAIAAGDARLVPLAKVCEFSLTYLQELPDFICRQTTTEKTELSENVLRAQVSFEKGRESYSQVRLNGTAVDAAEFLGNNGMTFNTGGEFGSFLADLFKPSTATKFRFEKEAKLGRIPATVYELDVPAGTSFWKVRDSRGRVANPEFRGQIWVERSTGRLLKLEVQAVSLPRLFEVASIRMTTVYAQSQLGEAGAFVLPTGSETEICDRSANSSCTKNVLAFRNCQKFAATTRVVADAPEH